MLEKFIYAKEKSLFETALSNGEVLDEAIVFIEDTKEIWNHGTYFDGSTFDSSNIEQSIQNISNTIADYATIRSAASTAVQPDVIADMETKTEAAAKYATIDTVEGINNTLNNYLTKTDASSTYLAKNSKAASAASADSATKATQDASGNVITSTYATKTELSGKASTSNATQSAAGLMSASDKTKLDGIASGANAYSLPNASSSTLGGVKVGSNISVSSGTISLTKANVTAALGYTPPTTDTNTWRPLGTTADTACAGNDSRLSNSRPASDVYSWAKASSKPSYTYSEVGAAPASHTHSQYITDITKAMVTTALGYTPPTTNTTYSLVGANGTTGLIKNGSSVTSTSGLTACPIISGVPYYKDTNTTYTLSSLGIGNVKNYDQSKAIKAITRSGTTFTYTCLDGTTGTFTQQDNNTTYSVATTSANGLMAAADKSLSNFLQNATTATTLSSLNVGYSTIYATLSGATTISLSGTLATGRSMTVICNPTASFTQPIPTSGSFISMDGDALKVTSGKFFEINIYAYASGKYSISCKVAS